MSDSAGPARGIVLAGPTASGKSGLALALARALAPGLRIEIVSVDSALVYRGMDVGTAKPSPAEQAEVPHHLIDLIEPTETYSAARFIADAQQACRAIRARGALPLLVGGTMLYVRALRQGLDDIPPSDPQLRAGLDARAAAEGWPALHAELQRVDPVTAARLAPRDAQRIQRALEVYLGTGRPLSSFQRKTGPARQQAGGATDAACANEWPLIALEPASRAWLHARIEARFDTMLAQGFVDEVRRLRARGGLHAGLPSMRCVGYRQAWEALERGDLSGLREAGVAATRQLAKRQLTWLRGMPDRHTVACDRGDPAAEVVALVRRLARCSDGG